MAVNLDQAAAQAPPYSYVFTTGASTVDGWTKPPTTTPGYVYAASPVGQTRREFCAVDVATVLVHINSYENHRINRGLPTR